MSSMLSKRGASIGYGSKYDLTNYSYINVPFYDRKSDFDLKSPHGPAFSFGISREHYEKVLKIFKVGIY